MERAATREEALHLIGTAPEVETTEHRIELVRRLLGICRERGYTFASWNKPLLPELDSFGDIEVLQAIEDLYQVHIDEALVTAAALETFGDLVRFFEEHLPELPDLVDVRAGRGCPTQRAFYMVRRAVRDLSVGMQPSRPLCPATPLESVLRPEELKAFSQALARISGVHIAPESRVLGRLEFGAAWLTGWFCCVLLSFALLFALGERMGVVGLCICLLGSAVLVAILLDRLSLPCWPRQYATLGDMARLLASPDPVAESRS